MHFCSKCGNMFYLKLAKKDDESEDILIYYCRNCGHEDTNLISNLNNLYVSKTDIKTKTNYTNIINKFTKLDPTLPRITNIDCPNHDCASNIKDKSEEKEEKEIIYIRYDDKNMKFLYLCAVCDTVWNTETK
tara:strand:+ start:1686 stop:2081 length:396 start_codon:yes stop_codon:yes gene_type:complete